MPIKTPHYMLEAFLDGDIYYAASDQRRFRTVDNQLNRITELIGDGRIDGWEITEATFPDISISAGSGIIDKFYVNTFDDQTFELAADSTFYVYIQRKVGIIGIEGPRSDVKSLTYTDIIAPATTADFTATAVDSDTVLLEWTANTEVDLDHYDIEISTDGTNFTLIDTAESTDTMYEDSVIEDDTYYYRFYAVDESGNRSTPATDTVVVPLGTDLPANPINYQVLASENGINVLWNRPPTLSVSNIKNWKLIYTRLNSDNSEIDSTTVELTLNNTLLNYRIDDVLNGQRYKVTLQTIDLKDRLSTGVVKNIVPQPTPAPRDPINLSQSMSASPSGGVKLDLSWVSGDNEYDPAISYRYKIYLKVADSQESIAFEVPIGDTDYEISLYSFNGDEFFSVPENTLLTIRITAIDEDGFESFGTYLKFFSSVFSEPLPVENLTSSFNPDTGLITVAWDNQIDTQGVQIIVFADDLSESYFGDIEIINTEIDGINFYTFSGELNFKYSIYVTPYNSSGIYGGTPSATVILISVPNVPAPPTNIVTKTNDRQIQLSWLQSSSISVTSYNIYRKTGNISFTASDWNLIDTLPKELLRFTDYGLNNNQTYSYYITSVDIYGRESIHLPDGAINLNYVEATPKQEGILTEPTDVTVSFVGNDVLVTWESLNEEFNSFSLYRSVGNLHEWEKVITLDKNTLSYLDENIKRINGTTIYYSIDKTVNDADIVVQTTNLTPENSMFLAKITVGSSSMTFDISDRRDIKDMVDPLAEYTNLFLLPHKHTGIGNDPDRIDLNPELVITNWETVDGRIFTTKEKNISGTTYIVKVDGRFPEIFYRVDSTLRRLVFAEPITTFDSNGNVDNIPDIEVRVLGIEEVQNVLDNFRFDNIHARQIQFGLLNKEQLPDINHEGRIREDLIPKRYLLEKFNNYNFIVPQNNTDVTKTFGDGTTFYTIIESDGKIEDIIDFDTEDDDEVVGFLDPSTASDTQKNLKVGGTTFAGINSDPGGFQSTKSYNLQFEFKDNTEERWVRITTANAPIKPNPIIDLSKRVRFKILNTEASIYLSLGVREIDLITANVGDNGGTTGSIEWVGANSVVSDSDDLDVPVGLLIQASDEWQDIEIDLRKESIISYQNGNSDLTGNYGVLEHLAFTVNPDDSDGAGPFNIYIDKLQQITDVLVAGTSQGILLSEDFGNTWELSRYTDTPVHTFYRAENNEFLWAISGSEVLLSVDPANWFSCSGTTGIQFIKDIVDDIDGDMYISTDKGVYKLEIALIRTFATFRQTQPVTAFTTDCYAMYHNPISSGLDEIWVSTEIGIFKTVDKGSSWTDTGMKTAGLAAFKFINAGTLNSPNIFAVTRKHMVRKLGNESDFNTVANFEEQHDITHIWTFEFFDGRMYVSTELGVYMNSVDLLATPGISTIEFDKILPDLETNGFIRLAFGLDAVDIGDLGEKLFIGQENRLISVDENNNFRIKKEYKNREIPTFYENDVEIVSGYIYNSFNNVVCFREPRQVNKLITAVNLPRKEYFPVNGGWSQTNPDTEVFIYKNGIPTWLDFQYDEPDILSDVQVILGRLQSLPTLTSFNSLLPDSQTYLNSTIDSINTIINGGEEGVSLINNTTLVDYMDKYTRLLSLITSDLATNNNLRLPILSRTGISRDNRPAGTKAEILELKDDFEAEDSTGITINLVNGEVDFLTAFSNATSLEDRAKFSFSKYDDLQITILNSNISGTGEYTHRELEDEMEYVNSGLTSDLTKNHYGNMIRMGIFLEGQNHFMFDVYNSSNIQSRYYYAHNNDWYDILNSTVDYASIIKVLPSNEMRFVNKVVLFEDDPYFTNKIWIGTDCNISEFSYDSDGNLTSDKTVVPGNSTLKTYFIWDIFIRNGSDIYIVAEEKGTKRFKIFLTTNFGTTWTEIDTINLPNEIYSFKIINGIKVVSTESGMFYCDNSFGTWFETDVVPSDVLGDESDAIEAFSQGIFNVTLKNFMIVESDRWFYTSGQGIEFFAVGRITNNSASTVGQIHRFKNLTWVATDVGLYNDGNSLLGDNAQFGLETTLEDSSTESAAVEVNDIVSGKDALYCGASNGKIYRRYDSGSGDEWKRFIVPGFGPIHKMLFIAGDTKDIMIVFSYNKVQSLDVTIGSGVFD